MPMSFSGAMSLQRLKNGRTFMSVEFKEKARLINSTCVDLLTGYDRVYFGHEFCAHLMPTEKRITQLLDLYGNKQLTFVTSVMTDKSFADLRRLLELLIASDKKIEVVVNDFGVMRYIAREFSQFSIVCGRNLFTQLLNPDSYQKVKMASRGFGFIASSYKKEQKLFNISLYRLLRQYGIQRIELNDLDDVLRYAGELSEHNFKVSLYFPFSYLSITRYCYFALKHVGFKGHKIIACNKECVNKYAKIEKMFLSKRVYLSGNTLFVKDKRNPNVVKMHIDRLIENEV